MQQKPSSSLPCGASFFARWKLLTVAAIGLLGSSGLQAAADGPGDLRAQTTSAGKSTETLADPHAGAGPRIETIRFPRGTTSSTIKGQLKGYDTIDYRLRAEAGQTLRVTLTTGNRQTYFNVNPPGTETAMFVGSTSGGRFDQVLPVEGDYTVRVYLMRAGARRGESSRYTLGIGVTGKPLQAKSAIKDALVPGTPYHASGTVSCSIHMAPKVSECKAFVIRRDAEATATVELRWPLGSGEALRRILIVQGKAICADSPDPISQSHDGDRYTIRIGTDERFEFPDAFVTGG
jgi:hypothetical protein